MKPFSTSLLKSPTLHFILLGMVAFTAYSYLKPPDRETIQVTTQTIDALIQQQESITQNPVSPDGRQLIVDSHIEDEVLLREAYKRGFDKNDYRVRKRLLNIMRSSSQRGHSRAFGGPAANILPGQQGALPDVAVTLLRTGLFFLCERQTPGKPGTIYKTIRGGI